MQARKSLCEGGIPIGSVLVHNGEIIGRGHNSRVQTGSPIDHGEMNCLRNAGRLSAGVYRGCTLYTTLSPCLMCSGALYWSKIGRIVFGATDEKNGYRKVAANNSPFHPKTIVTGGVLEAECALLMKNFFKAKR